MENYTEKEIMKIKNDAFGEGQKHSHSSPETLELFRKMDEKMDKIKDELKNDISDIKVAIAKLPKDLIDQFDKRYASKETEKIVKYVIGMISIAFITALIGLVWK